MQRYRPKFDVINFFTIWFFRNPGDVVFGVGRPASAFGHQAPVNRREELVGFLLFERAGVGAPRAKLVEPLPVSGTLSIMN